MSRSWGWVHRGFVHDWEEVKRSFDTIKKVIQVWEWYLENDLIWLKYRLRRTRAIKLYLAYRLFLPSSA